MPLIDLLASEPDVSVKKKKENTKILSVENARYLSSLGFTLVNKKKCRF